MFKGRQAAFVLIFVSYTIAKENEDVKEKASELVSEAGDAMNEISKACDINDSGCVKNHERFDNTIKLLELIQRLSKETDVLKEIGNHPVETSTNAISKPEGSTTKNEPKTEKNIVEGNSKPNETKKDDTKDEVTKKPDKPKKEESDQKVNPPEIDKKKDDNNGKTNSPQDKNQLDTNQKHGTDNIRDNFFRYFFSFYFTL